MNQVIIYGSQYGSTYRYAQQLSEETNIPAVSYREAPDLSRMHTIIYMGGLYAGGVVGLAKALRGFSIQNGQKLLLVTVGLADPDESRKPGQYPNFSAKAAFSRTDGTGEAFSSSRQDRLSKALFWSPDDDETAVPILAQDASWKNKQRKTGRS